MRGNFFMALIILLPTAWLAAQPVNGLTGVPDTSYTTGSAYRSTVKTHPQITVAEVPKSKGVREQTGIRYRRIDRITLLMDAFYPAPKRRVLRPAILIIHGGGWRSGNPGQHHNLARALADRGYACFTPAYRLSTHALYPAAVEDVNAAFAWIKKHAGRFGVDTGKMVLLGFSAGGQLASLLATTWAGEKYRGAPKAGEGPRPAALVNLDGILSFVHPESGEGDDSRRTSAATYWFGLPRKEAEALWEEASPLTHAGKSTPPTLFINSGVARMHAGRDAFIGRLANEGIYTEVHTFEDAPHSFPLFHPWFNPMVETIDQFLRKVLKK
jgi:acetyl esterase/lipase